MPRMLQHIDIGEVRACCECNTRFIVTTVMVAEASNDDGYMGRYWYKPLLQKTIICCPCCGSKEIARETVE
jgi:hypothetical protein